MASVRQQNANKANARKSTGPKSEAGKEQSRRNAYKHGLTGDGVVVDEAFEREVAETTAEWRQLFNLVDKHDEIVFSEMILNRVKLDRARREESCLTAYYMERAGSLWKSDREMEAAELAAKIADDPAVIVLRLKKTSHGSDWLIHRWKQLLATLESGKAWTETQRVLMCDLAGVSHDVRDPDDPTGTTPGCPDAIAFVRSEIAEIESHKSAGLDYFDELERQAAEAGFPIHVPKPLALIRRYIIGFSRAYRQALHTLLKNGRQVRTQAKPAQPAAEPKVVPPRTQPLTALKPIEPATPFPPARVAETVNPVAPTSPLPPVRLSDARMASPRYENRRERRARLKLAGQR